MIILTIHYSPKAMGSVKQHKMRENFRRKKEIVKAHSFFMSPRFYDGAHVKSFYSAQRNHTQFIPVSVLRLAVCRST